MAHELSTIDEVIDALGGTAKAGAIARVRPSTISMWKARKRIPATTFLVFQGELRRLGLRADPSLWGMQTN